LENLSSKISCKIIAGLTFAACKYRGLSAFDAERAFLYLYFLSGKDTL
jgi:hypothetical protein